MNTSYQESSRQNNYSCSTGPHGDKRSDAEISLPTQRLILPHHPHRSTHAPNDEGRVAVNHIQDVVHEFLRTLQQVAQVVARAFLEDLRELGVCEHAQYLVVDVVELDGQLHGEGEGQGKINTIS